MGGPKFEEEERGRDVLNRIKADIDAHKLREVQDGIHTVALGENLIPFVILHARKSEFEVYMRADTIWKVKPSTTGAGSVVYNCAPGSEMVEPFEIVSETPMQVMGRLHAAARAMRKSKG